MLLLDSEALSAVAQGPADRRDRVCALIPRCAGASVPSEPWPRSLPRSYVGGRLTPRSSQACAASASGCTRSTLGLVFAPGSSSAPSGLAPSWPSMRSSWRSATSWGSRGGDRRPDRSSAARRVRDRGVDSPGVRVAQLSRQGREDHTGARPSSLRTITLRAARRASSRWTRRCCAVDRDRGT